MLLILTISMSTCYLRDLESLCLDVVQIQILTIVIWDLNSMLVKTEGVFQFDRKA